LQAPLLGVREPVQVGVQPRVVRVQWIQAGSLFPGIRHLVTVRVGLRIERVRVEAVDHTVTVRVRIERICFCRIDLPVCVPVLDPVGEEVAVRVGVRGIGLGPDLAAVEETVAVQIPVDPAVPVCVLKAIGQTVIVGVRREGVGLGPDLARIQDPIPVGVARDQAVTVAVLVTVGNTVVVGVGIPRIDQAVTIRVLIPEWLVTVADTVGVGVRIEGIGSGGLLLAITEPICVTVSVQGIERWCRPRSDRHGQSPQGRRTVHRGRSR
jgi:hypothetical protein